ncbi:hypothetical protein M0R45_030370 [Rubus argutus]|uniref:MHC class I antigen n=1 Tax=Rubus argutus TaxID=59490 RepID=A0AAW1WDC3_RUBAR
MGSRQGAAHWRCGGLGLAALGFHCGAPVSWARGYEHGGAVEGTAWRIDPSGGAGINGGGAESWVLHGGLAYLQQRRRCCV